MRRILTTVAMILWVASSVLGQPQAAPQTARQALLEMFFSKTPGTLEKHLPEALRAALNKAQDGGAPSMMQQFSMLSGQLNSQGQVQTFEAGSTLLTAENAKNGTKFEIIVDSDDLRGDEDEISLSFRSYKDGQSQAVPVFPKLTFLMKSEAGSWRLNELTFAIRVALGDPDFLKLVTAGMQQRQARMQGDGVSPVPNPVNDDAAVASLRKIATAEAAYAATYPMTGYTCSLSDLDGFGGGMRNEHQAMLIESRLASGKKNGYIFALSGCDGPPATRFRLSATPAMAGMGLRAFCTDQSGAVHYSANGQAASCLSAGTPLN